MNKQETSTASGAAGGSRRPAEPLLLTANQVAQLLQVSPRTLWRLVSASQTVAPIKVGGATRWRRTAVEQWIADGCPAQPAGDNSKRR